MTKIGDRVGKHGECKHLSADLLKCVVERLHTSVGNTVLLSILVHLILCTKSDVLYMVL